MKYCPVSKKCGGCAYIDVPYEEQLKMKREEMRKIFHTKAVEPVLGMKDPYHYRHKIYASFARDKKTNRIYAGMYEENSHRKVPSEMCLIQHTLANEILTTICKLAESMRIEIYDEDSGRGTLRHAYIRISKATNDVLLDIVIGSKGLPSSKNFVNALVKKFPQIKTIILNFNRAHTSMILGKDERVLYGPGYITDRIGGLEFRISSKSFYQVNPEQTEVLYRTALSLAKIKDTDVVLDACCGIGTISLLAAQSAKHVIGVEINPQAIRDAKNNAKHNKLLNTEFYSADAAEFIQRMNIKPDVVILDPPRSGMTLPFMRKLAQLSPDRVVYISCNPYTQVTDIEPLKKAGYKIKKIVPVDIFGFTPHVETIVLLSKLESKNHISVELPMDDMDLTSAESKATYEQIQNYVLEKYDFKVSTLYIAQVKRKYGLEVRKHYNISKNGNQKVPQCPIEKEEAILAALKHFKMIS